MSPIYKKNEEFLLTNYRPISGLSCFSKLLERIMYNRLFKTLQIPFRKFSFLKTICFSDISWHWACYSTTCESTLSIVWWKQVHVRNFNWFKQNVWHSGPQNSNKKAWVIWD